MSKIGTEVAMNIKKQIAVGRFRGIVAKYAHKTYGVIALNKSTIHGICSLESIR